MYSYSDLPWMKIYDFLLDVGYVREPKELCIQTIKKIQPLIPYDQARIYFVNSYGKIDDEFLIGVKQMWSDLYLEYYSKIENCRYAILPGHSIISAKTENSRYMPFKFKGGVCDWTNWECDEFITEYIKPQRISYTIGFGLYSVDGFMRGVIILDRTSRSKFTDKEINIMNIIQPHVENLYKNLFVLATNIYFKNSEVQKLLTKRELEIAKLLLKGLTPVMIGHSLFVSLQTVYKHIANMHTKLNVSNRQELFLKLINYFSKQENRE